MPLVSKPPSTRPSQKTSKKASNKANNKALNVALLCGGPSLERGISLNSARSVCDHLSSDDINIHPIYFDHQKKSYRISQKQLYSNTPSDFDFKLATSALQLGKDALRRYLKRMDLVFPAMHGPFGEDGGIQSLLEKWNCPFIGSGSSACKVAFDKYVANEFIRNNGFCAMPSLALDRGKKGHGDRIRTFFKQHKIKRAIVKPATGGSSIAVYSVSSVSEALKSANIIFNSRVDRRVVVEPFCRGIEFTVIILQNRYGMPVAIMPTEIELDYKDHQIFDYRKKYLATRQVTYHCPPRFSDEVVERIQIQAEQLFALLEMRDFGRFDGWVLPDGKLWFSDFNPISGMEQNSFLFMQAARIGMSHRDVLRYVTKSACRRYGIAFPETESKITKRKKQVNVLFGGSTAERQVSLMSGTNVWLKLRNSTRYHPEPHLLDFNNNVWRLPYAFALNHTVEEVVAMCRSAAKDEARLLSLKLRVVDKLALKNNEATQEWFLPQKKSLAEFIKTSPFVFLGLHGGIGEDGTLQRELEKRKIPFNGPGSKASLLCMDKYKTGEALKNLSDQGIYSAKKKRVSLRSLLKANATMITRFWDGLRKDLGGKSLIVKPLGDGCSSGVARLYVINDLRSYLKYAAKGGRVIPPRTLTKQEGIIEMPTHPSRELLFEEFIETDRVEVVGKDLRWKTINNWIEITVGVVEERGKMRAMNPSITVAGGSILSLEEKFQGGTGVNITPPPEKYVKIALLNEVKEKITLVAATLGLKGYARIDAFMNIKSGEIIIIEVNTLPGLTPSTVIYHQALEENPPLYPVGFLEKIVANGFTRFR